MCDLGEHTATQEFEENDQQGSTTKRWARITHRHGIWNDLRGPYTAQEIKQAQQLTRNLRNITAHGADDVLVNLGYPPELRRRLLGGKILTGNELSLARAASATPVLRHAVRNVLERVARGAIENDWADDWFRAQFEANDGS